MVNFLKIVVVIFVLLGIFGCQTDMERSINSLKKPVYVVAISKDGSVLLLCYNEFAECRGQKDGKRG